MEAVATAANKVLYQFSGLHFHGIFNKIILRCLGWDLGAGPGLDKLEKKVLSIGNFLEV